MEQKSKTRVFEPVTDGTLSKLSIPTGPETLRKFIYDPPIEVCEGDKITADLTTGDVTLTRTLTFKPSREEAR